MRDKIKPGVYAILSAVALCISGRFSVIIGGWAKLAAELTNTELGSEMQVSRQSVSKKFRNGDMRLSDFIQIARLAGDLPSSILAKAEAKSALAGKEVA